MESETMHPILLEKVFPNTYYVFECIVRDGCVSADDLMRVCCMHRTNLAQIRCEWC